MNKALAINGGVPVRTEVFPDYRTIQKEEINAANRVLNSGILSKYLGTWHEDFMGGEEVRNFEKQACELYGVKYALAVNSCTSGLYAAIGALQIEPGDEVICSPYTMAASATAAFVFNGIPVFADIDENTFCLSLESIEKNITKRTKVIIVPHIFGYPAEIDKITELAKNHNIYVIEDCAQIPYGKYRDKIVGTFGDIGVFSLNYHKHIQTGEGGLIVTDNEDLYNRMALIRNHAEAVIGNENAIKSLKIQTINNLLGFNFRMNEIEAAMATEQLKKVKYLIDQRIENCNYLTEGLKNLRGLEIHNVPEHIKNNYYVYSIKYDSTSFEGLSRNSFVKALKAELPLTRLREKEGVLIGEGYVRPLYLLPVYQQKIMFGSNGVPWTFNDRYISYQKGLCPTCEDMHFNKLITTELIRPGMSKKDLDDVVSAFKKVVENYKELL